MRDPVKTVYAVTLFAMMLLAGCFGSGVVDTPEVEAQAAGSEVTLAQFTTLEGAVTAAENAITTVQTSLADHETRIAALETKLAAAEAALQGLNNQATGGTNAAPIVEVNDAAFVRSDGDAGGRQVGGGHDNHDDHDYHDDMGYEMNGHGEHCDSIIDAQILNLASNQYLNSNHFFGHEDTCSTDDNIGLAIDLKALDIDGDIVSMEIDFDADGVVDSPVSRLGGNYLADLPADFWDGVSQICEHEQEHCDYLFFIAVTDDLGARTWAVGGAWMNFIEFDPIMSVSFSINDAGDDLSPFAQDALLTITPDIHWPGAEECDDNGWQAPCYDVRIHAMWFEQWGYYHRSTDWYRLAAIDHNVGATWQAQQTMTLSEGLEVGGEYSGSSIDVCATNWGEGPYAWNPCHTSGTIAYLDDHNQRHHWNFNIEVY